MTAEKAISIMQNIQKLLASHHEEDVEVVLAIQAGINALQAQEPKSGHWVDKCCRDFRCSECGHRLVNNNWVRSDGYCHDDLPKYCPECGVKMERGIIQRRFVGEDKIVYPDYNKNIENRRANDG